MQESFGKKAELDGQCQYFWAALCLVCSSLSICCKCCLKQGISIKGFIYFLHYSRTLCPCKLFRSRMWSKGWNQPFNACIDLFELCGNSFSGNHFILTKNESWRILEMAIKRAFWNIGSSKTGLVTAADMVPMISKMKSRKSSFKES